MPLILTPGQLAQRSEFYHQLGQLTAAGLGLTRALEQIQRAPPSCSFRAPVRVVLAEIAEGYTFTESVRRARPWLPDFDVALLDAGERSGRLDACFRLLADHYATRASMAREMIADLAYPVFLLHFAVFILPFAQLFTTGDWVTYLTKTLGILLPLYAVVGVLIFAAQSQHGEVWRGWFERIVGPLPILGKARREMALARLATALEALISAGVSIIEAWELAATVSGSPALRRTVDGWRPNVEAGQTPAEAINASGKFPDLFANQYASGEISGKLDEVLRRLSHYYQEEGTRKLRAVAQWTPRIAYLIVALAIAWQVIKFWSAYFREIRNVLEGF